MLIQTPAGAPVEVDGVERRERGTEDLPDLEGNDVVCRVGVRQVVASILDDETEPRIIHPLRLEMLSHERAQLGLDLDAIQPLDGRMHEEPARGLTGAQPNHENLFRAGVQQRRDLSRHYLSRVGAFGPLGQEVDFEHLLLTPTDEGPIYELRPSLKSTSWYPCARKSPGRWVPARLGITNQTSESTALSRMSRTRCRGVRGRSSRNQEANPMSRLKPVVTRSTPYRPTNENRTKPVASEPAIPPIVLNAIIRPTPAPARPGWSTAMRMASGKDMPANTAGSRSTTATIQILVEKSVGNSQSLH